MSTPVGGGPVGKGRPTPKRSEARGARGGPVPPPPATRKEAAKRAREQAALARTRTREGTARGDQKAMLPRDQGPVRALVRDAVDGRRNVGVLLLPLALLLVVAQFSREPRLIGIALTFWLAGVLAMVVDVVVTSVVISRRVRAAFPEEGSVKGHVGYGLLRSTQFRRFRLPPPQVTPGSLRRDGSPRG